MTKKFVLGALFLLSLWAWLPLRPPLFAQQPSKTANVPSDLALDLNLAKENPAPEQKEIIASQTRTAEITTEGGEKIVAKPVDTVPAEIQTEPAESAVHAELSTSSQVVSRTETVEETGAPSQNTRDETTAPDSSSSQGNLVPGTQVLEPNDNAAPPPEQSPDYRPELLPTLAPNPVLQAEPSTSNSTNSESSPQTTIESAPQTNQPTDNSQNNPPPPNVQSNSSEPPSIPPENGTQNSQPAQSSGDTNNSQPAQQSEPPPSNDSNSSDQNAAVEGATTKRSWWQIFLGNIKSFLNR